MVLDDDIITLLATMWMFKMLSLVVFLLRLWITIKRRMPFFKHLVIYWNIFISFNEHLLMVPIPLMHWIYGVHSFSWNSNVFGVYWSSCNSKRIWMNYSWLLLQGRVQACGYLLWFVFAPFFSLFRVRSINPGYRVADELATSNTFLCLLSWKGASLNHAI